MRSLPLNLNIEFIFCHNYDFFSSIYFLELICYNSNSWIPLHTAFAGRCGESQIRKKIRTIFFLVLVVVGDLPDLDIFAGFWGMKAYLFYHRGITHSFVGIVTLALLAALILFFYYAEEINSFLYFYLICFSALLIHLFGDWATSYGTPLLLPFSNKNYSLDWISNLSLFVIAIIGAASGCQTEELFLLEIDLAGFADLYRLQRRCPSSRANFIDQKLFYCFSQPKK